MWKKVTIAIFVVIFLSLFSSYFYSRAIAQSIKLKYFPPSVGDSFQHGKVEFILKYPIAKVHFLRNIDFNPEIKGDFYFSKEFNYLFNIKGYKKIIFIPEEIERDKSYKIDIFKKEFVFSLPSPKTKKLLFDEKEKKLEIEFFEPINEEYFFKQFKITPSVHGRYFFSDYDKKVTFVPKIIEEGKDYKTKIFDKEIVFKVDFPKVKDIYFDELKKQIVATITEPSSEEEISQNFKISPSLRVDFSLDNKKTTIVIRPKELKENQTYKLKIFNKNFSFKLSATRVKNIYFDQNKQQVVIVFTNPIERARFLKSFKITPSLEGDFIFSSEKDWVIFKPNNIEKNKTYTITILGARLAFRLYSIYYISGKYIDIDLSSQSLRLYRSGKVLSTYPISSGRYGMGTPTGTFSILSKESLHWSNKYSLYMPYSLRFYNGYYIHELPYWPGGYREGTWHLGIPVSHGCVRLGIGAARRVYSFADIGTKIVIHY